MIKKVLENIFILKYCVKNLKGTDNDETYLNNLFVID